VATARPAGTHAAHLRPRRVPTVSGGHCGLELLAKAGRVRAKTVLGDLAWAAS
jgi:hypothetical protein